MLILIDIRESHTKKYIERQKKKRISRNKPYRNLRCGEKRQ